MKARMKSSIILSVCTVTLVSCWTEEAPYEVIQSYDGWDVRRFLPTKWISTEAQDVRPHDGASHSEVNTIISQNTKF